MITNLKNFFRQNEIDWPVFLFLTLLPVVAVISAAIYLAVVGWVWSIMIFALIFAALTNLSITAGYHRLFAHRSYEAHPVVRWLLILIGTSAWQGSVMRWATGHRRHHAFEDTEKDPYNINAGFWFAHMGWMVIKQPELVQLRAADLEKSKLIVFQDKHYVWLAILCGFGLPTLVGWMLGHPLGGLVFGGFLRVFLTQHSTYFINSLCHYWGKKPYEKEITARDSLLMAFLTHGEGYHNFHHKFQSDYRNGYKWYQWDPTKWTIRSLAAMGLAKKLKRIPQIEITRATLQMEEVRLRSLGYSQEKLDQLKEKILGAQLRLKKLKEDYAALRSQLKQTGRDKVDQVKIEIELAKIDLRMSLKVWRLYLKSPLVRAS